MNKLAFPSFAHMQKGFQSGQKRAQTRTFGSGYLPVGWGGLPREGLGAKKFGMSLEAHGKLCFGGISRDFGWDILGVHKKFESKKVCVQCLAPIQKLIIHFHGSRGSRGVRCTMSFFHYIH